MARGDLVSVWDLPIRLFHWALLALVVTAWWSQKSGDLNLHRMVGSTVAGLLVFRIWWGVFGSSTARFASFVKGPRVALTYARTLFSKADGHSTGHNPLGGWSVAALIACLAVLIGCGLFAVDVDGLESGPLSSLVTFESGRLASKVHSLAFQGLEALVVLHLLAIAFYAVFKRQDLVGPMVTGRRRGTGPAMIGGSPMALGVGLMLGAVTTAALLHLSGVF